ncbi:hypothetical protein BD779DRAFT_1556097 [Infundibulicybe gibba]|nr:hypothetical protein BD779DRAFT_1556097 [Infundibulicybe gibba]
MLICCATHVNIEVYPAAGYGEIVRACGEKVAVFNIERSKGDKMLIFCFLDLAARADVARGIEFGAR